MTQTMLMIDGSKGLMQVLCRGCLWMCLCCLFSIDRATAQRAPFRQMTEVQSEDLFLLAPREQKRLLREGKSAIEEQRYSDGIAALGTLLMDEARVDPQSPTDEQQQDYFIEPNENNSYNTSVKGEAMRLLGMLPEEGRKSLEIRYGVTARQKLQAAVADRDFNAIGEVSRRYFHTDAGYDATLLLAQERLARGYPLAASGILQRLVDVPAARARYGAQLIGVTAGSWLHAQRPEAAIRVLEKGALELPGAKTYIGDREIELLVNSDWRRIIDQSNPTRALSDQRLVDAWTTTGGTPDRNASIKVGMPLPIARWAKSIHRDARDEEAILATEQREKMQGKVLLPRIEARLLSDMLLVKTTDDRLVSIDFETGLYRWPFYFHSAPVDLMQTRNPYEFGVDGSVMSQELQERIWGRSSFGQFSCDSDNFYFISTAEQRPLNSRTVFNQSVRATVGDNTNFMEGVSIAAEGAIQWRIGGSDGEDEPALADAYFLGPPLPFEGQLYTLVEVNGETRLVVLDAKSGRKLWSQQLVHSPTVPISFDAVRRAQALAPSIGDGTIVCPTGHGAVVAVDMLTRSLRWATHYKSRNSAGLIGQFNMGFNNSETFDALQERWQEPTVIVHQGTVLLTPPEDDSIICIDSISGKLQWQQKRGVGRYIAGVFGDRVIVVGNQVVYALNLRDGRATWGRDNVLPAGEFVAGKSVRHERYLFVPTSAKRVIKLDLESGSMVDSTVVDRPLGNLFAYKNDLVSVSSTEVSVYHTRDALAEEVSVRLAANPDDIRALNQKAQLELAENKVDVAVELLSRSLKIDASSEDTKYLLVRALLTGLGQDFERYLPLADQLDGAVEFGPQRFKFLVLLAQGNIRAGQYRQALERLLQLVQNRKRSAAPETQPQHDIVAVDDKHEVDADAWIAVQLLRTMQLAAPEDRQAMQQMILTELRSPQNQVLPVRRDLLRYFCWLPESHSGILAVAQNLLGGVEQTTAERLIQPVALSGDDELRPLAQAMLKQVARQDRELLQPLQELGIGDSQGLLLASERSEEATWPRGFVQHETVEGNMMHGIGLPIPQTRNRYGRPTFEISLAGEMLLIANEFGDSVGRMEYDRPTADGVDHFLRCQVEGGIILLETHTELIAFDFYRGLESPQDAMLWRHSLSIVPTGPGRTFQPPDSSPEASPLGFVHYRRSAISDRQCIVGPITPAGVVIQKGSEVSILDLLSGNQVWSRTGFSDRTSLAASGLEVAVVDSSTGLSHIFDCRDGAAIRTVPYRGHWKPWSTNGALLIEYSQRESTTQTTGIVGSESFPSVLRVFDAFTGEIAVEREFQTASRASMSDNRYLVALEPQGNLWFYDVLTGRTASHSIDPLTDVNNIHLQRFQDRLVLLTNTAKVVGNLVNTNARVDQLSWMGTVAVSGPFYALSAQTGALLWNRPGKLQQFRFSLDQPRSSPFMALHRPNGDVNITRNSVGSLVVVDLRDGTLAFANNAIASAGNMTSVMELEPLTSSLRVSLGNSVTTLLFTNQPKPPQPVCSYGFTAMPSSRLRSQSGRNIFDPVFPR